jgi:hypothetical protein
MWQNRFKDAVDIKDIKHKIKEGFVFMEDRTNYNPHEMAMIARIKQLIPEQNQRSNLYNTVHQLKKKLNFRLTDVYKIK